MKSTFSRTFFPAAMVLLAALMIVGIALDFLVGNFLKKQAVSGLEKDGQAICELASAYYSSEASGSGHDCSYAWAGEFDEWLEKHTEIATKMAEKEF